MLIIPAIDIKQGKCVRLTQGNFSQEKVYSDDPVQVAKVWEEQGAHMLHIVDLDGAKDGMLTHMDMIVKIRNAVSIPIEVGGGIRTAETADQLIKYGIDRIILGTIALEDPALLQTLTEQHRDKISVSLDAKDGKLLSHGWVTQTSLDIIATAKGLEHDGISRIHYTDVTKDGTLTTPNFPSIQSFLSLIRIPCVIGGGISTIADIQTLASLGAEGVVIGKAIYEGTLSITEAVLCLPNASSHA